MKYKHNQLGRTLIEALAVMAVIGALSASIFSVVGSMIDKYKSSIILTQIRDLRKAINHRYAALGIYTGLTPQILITERLAPLNMVENNKLYHSLQGEVTLSVGNTGGAGRSFKITFNKVPLKNCMDLGVIDWSTDTTAALSGITINSNNFVWEKNKYVSGVLQPPSATALPMTFAKVAGSCRPGDNTLTWEFQ